MDLIISLIALEIIASKFLAIYISSYRPEGPYHERNPLLRMLLNRLKIQHEVWLSFFCTILLVGISLFLLNHVFSGMANYVLFVLAGSFITVLNLGSAHSTYFNRTNFITRRLLR